MGWLLLLIALLAGPAGTRGAASSEGVLAPGAGHRPGATSLAPARTGGPAAAAVSPLLSLQVPAADDATHEQEESDSIESGSLAWLQPTCRWEATGGEQLASHPADILHFDARGPPTS